MNLPEGAKGRRALAGQQSARSEHDSAQATVPGSLRQLFGDFDTAGLDWCLLRPWEGLASPEGDIDVLLSRAGFPLASNLLCRADFIEMRPDGEDLHFAKFEETSGRFLWVHVQSELKVGGAKIAADALLPSKQRNRFPELAPEWLLWSMLIRAIQKGGLAQRYRDRVVKLASVWTGGPAQLVDRVKQAGLDPDELVGRAAAADWEALVRNRWASPGSGHTLPVGWTDRLTRVLSGVVRPRHRGLCVAIIGPDGAGKSTLIQSLRDTLPLRTRTMYMGLTGGRMRRTGSLKVPGLVFAAKAALLWAKFGRALLYRAAGQIVLFDRYPFDGAVPPGRPIPALARFSRRIQRRILPAPDLVLLLDVSGQTMYDRKQAYAAETLEAWRAHYRKLQSEVPRLVIVDAERPAAEVLRSAQMLIWDKLRRRRAS